MRASAFDVYLLDVLCRDSLSLVVVGLLSCLFLGPTMFQIKLCFAHEVIGGISDELS